MVQNRSWAWGMPSTESVRTVPLWWNAFPISVRTDGRVAEIPTVESLGKMGCSGAIVYALEARYDAQSGPIVVYIGESTAAEGRLPASLSRVIDDEYGALFSDCTDVVVRWASVDEGLREDVEAALIVSHAPPFNAQLVRRQFTRQQITVFNAGAKGRLLGVIDSRYVARATPWPRSPP